MEGRPAVGPECPKVNSEAPRGVISLCFGKGQLRAFTF